MELITAEICRKLSRQHITATPLLSGKVLVVGGRAHLGITLDNTSAIYDPEQRVFIDSGIVVCERFTHAAIRMRNGNVLIAGGINAHGVPIASCEIYDHITGTFSACAALSYARCFGKMSLRFKGKPVITGGDRVCHRSKHQYEVYDLKSNTWLPISHYEKETPPAQILCRCCGSKNTWIYGTSKKNYICMPCRGLI